VADADQDHLSYYLRELSTLQEAGSAFAARYPRVAADLGLDLDRSNDPNVARLIESFAFLTGRIQRNIDQQFPRIGQSLLEVLYPELVSPIPSMAIAQFAVQPAEAQAAQGFVVPRATQLFAQAEDGVTCRFNTSYDVEVWPIEVADAALVSPALYQYLDDRPDIASVLRLRLRAMPGQSFADMQIGRLRFHIAGSQAISTALYELLFNQAQHIALVDPIAGLSADAEPGLSVRTSERPAVLTPDHLSPVGFADEEAVIPHMPYGHQAYRLVQEFFCFPAKYLFVDVHGLDERGPPASGRYLDLVIPLGRGPSDVLRVDRSTFKLGCTPIVNVFRKITEPIRIDQTRTEYRLQPDSRFERSTEILRIESVSSSAADSPESLAISPYFSFDHEEQARGQSAFWIARREPTARRDMSGTDIFLSFRNFTFNPSLPATDVVFARTLCTNRGLAEQIVAGATMELDVDVPAVARCLTSPTPQVAPPDVGEDIWRLVSMLSLNHLSLHGGADGLAALREILRLFSGARSPVATRQIGGLAEIASRRVTRHIGEDAWRGFCRGHEVTLTVDEEYFIGGGDAYLVASVLSRFLGLYAGTNSFVELVLKSRQREGEWERWPPVACAQILL
jgi:type VI secretion system protein ImpG